MDNFFSTVKNTCTITSGVVIASAITQALWNNHTVRKIALWSSVVGALVGSAIAVAAIFGSLLFSIPVEGDRELASESFRLVGRGALTATISCIAFILI